MLKWKFQTDEEGESKRIKLLRVRRAGIECQRRTIAKATLMRKLRELTDTVSFQAKIIDKLLMDKKNSLRILEDVMEEFSRLEHQITATDKEIESEKEEGINLRTQLNHLKNECENLRLCGTLLQREVNKAQSVNRPSRSREQPETQQVKEIKHNSFTSIHQEKTSHEETYQNIENESRLEVQEKSIVQADLVVPSDYEDIEPKAHMFLTSDIKKLEKKQRQRRTEACAFRYGTSTGCFRGFRLRRSRKVCSAN